MTSIIHNIDLLLQPYLAVQLEKLCQVMQIWKTSNTYQC